MARWIIVKIGGVRNAWNVGNLSGAQLEAALVRARIAAGMAAGDGAPGDVSLFDGNVAEIAPVVLATVVVRDPAELQAITPTQVQTYTDSWAQAKSSDRMDTARSAINALTAAEKVALRTEYGWGAAPLGLKAGGS